MAQDNLPLPTAGTTELIFNRTTTPLSSSFIIWHHFGDAKSVPRLQWCNAESQLLSEPEGWEGKCGPEPHWMLPMAAPQCRVSWRDSKREDEWWRWTGGGDYFSVVWITVLFKQGSSHFRSLCVEISVFSAHLPNMKIKQKLVLCKSKELNAYKCTSRFKNGIYGISFYLDWLWWASPYTTLCRDVISINKGVGLFRWVFQTSY